MAHTNENGPVGGGGFVAKFPKSVSPLQSRRVRQALAARDAVSREGMLTMEVLEGMDVSSAAALNAVVQMTREIADVTVRLGQAMQEVTAAVEEWFNEPGRAAALDAAIEEERKNPPAPPLTGNPVLDALLAKARAKGEGKSGWLAIEEKGGRPVGATIIAPDGATIDVPIPEGAASADADDEQGTDGEPPKWLSEMVAKAAAGPAGGDDTGGMVH